MIQAAFTAFNNKDYATALTLFQTLAEKNHPTAIASLGYIYQNGLGVAVDFDQARDYYIRGSELD
ncbi:MAG: hypothetical protein B7Y17_07000, partial [Sulfuricurvum sp. 24-42-5]